MLKLLEKFRSGRGVFAALRVAVAGLCLAAAAPGARSAVVATPIDLTIAESTEVTSRPRNSRFLEQIRQEATAALLNAAGNILEVSSLQIEGEYYRSDEEISTIIRTSTAGKSESVGLFHVDGLERLKEDPWFSEIKTSWSVYPLALKIHVTEREPWIVAEYAGEPWLISRNGIPLQPTRTIRSKDLAMMTSDLPRLDGIDPPPGSDSNLASPSTRLAYAIKLLRLIEGAGKLPYAAERFTLDNEGNLAVQPMNIASDPVVLIGPGDFRQISERIKELSTVAEDLRNRGEHPKRIDLRFQDQIIVE